MNERKGGNYISVKIREPSSRRCVALPAPSNARRSIPLDYRRCRERAALDGVRDGGVELGGRSWDSDPHTGVRDEALRDHQIVRLVTAAIRSIERLSQYEAAHRRSRSPQYQLRSATEEASRLKTATPEPPPFNSERDIPRRCF